MLKLNESSYNMFGMYEAFKGSDAVKYAINMMLNPTQKIEMQLAKTTEAIPSYDFSFMSKAFILEEPKKFKKLILPHVSLLVLRSLQLNKDNYIGEIGTYKIITKVENAKTVDTYQSDCFARTPWIDAERFVENKNGFIQITDIITTKTRMISRKESAADTFREDISFLASCADSVFITLSKDPAAISNPEELANEKKLGPELDVMTDQDAERLFTLSGPLISKASKKLFKYYNLKLQADPNNLKYLAAKARVLMSMGYISGTKFSASYIKEAQIYVNQGMALNQKNYHKELSLANFYALVRSGNFVPASYVLNYLSANEKEDIFSVYTASFELVEAQRAYPLAEKWARASEPFAKTKDNKITFLGNLISALQNQGKYTDSIQYSEKLIQLEPDNPWTYHNLALVYFDMGQFDKVIDLEKKALALSDFGAARSVLANAYYRKAKIELSSQNHSDKQVKLVHPAQQELINALSANPNMKVTVNGRDLASVQKEALKNSHKIEDYYLQAVKYDPTNIQYLTELVLFYNELVQYGDNWKADMQKAEHYLAAIREQKPQIAAELTVKLKSSFQRR